MKLLIKGIFVSALLFSTGTRVGPLLYAQETSATRGGLSGVITDGSGAAVPGAKVTLKGATDQKEVTTDATGRYTIGGLTPGLYSVTAKKEGFSATEAKNVNVVIGRLSSFDLSIQIGQVSDVIEVKANSVEVNTVSTAIGSNLDYTFYEQVPVARNVGSLFYTAPGAVNGGGTGNANPSIGGATGLENQYIIDGVNLTDVGYGGLGVFSPTYGSLGTGINLSFIQGVQVKTGALEPKYGRADGGIALIVTKTGGTHFHGAVSAYFAPAQFSSTQRYADDFFNRVNTHGRIFGVPQYDAAIELGGYIPFHGMRDKLFFFGAFNPSLNQVQYIAPAGSGLAAQGAFTNSITAYSWAGKITYKPFETLTFDASAFGDPSSSNYGYGYANQDTFPLYPNFNQANSSSFSRWNFGSRNEVFHMNAAITPTWVLNIAGTAKQTHFTESGFQNLYNITDTTQPNLGLAGAQFNAAGLGYYQNPDTHAYSFTAETEKTVSFFGTHTLSIGYEFDRAIYDLFKGYTGGTYAFPTTNSAGAATPAAIAGTQTSAGFKLIALNYTKDSPDPNCPLTLCPQMNIPGYGLAQVYLSQNRGIFSTPQAFTSVGYHQLYANDDWVINKHISVNAGLRWEEEQLNGVVQQYVFNDNWSPRVGINIDPFGDRKGKVFFNYARYTQMLPADAAVRELNQEQDVYRANYAPLSDANHQVVLSSLGTVIPVLDAAHLLSGNTAAGVDDNGVAAGAGRGLSISGSAPELIASGTKLNYEEEFVAGIERQVGLGFVVSARYTDRRLLRILEDLSGVSPEGALGADPNIGPFQNFLIGNPSPSADYFVNEQEEAYTTTPPANCVLDYGIQHNAAGDALGGACGQNPDVAGLPTPDGKADGFAAARRHYQALEIEANKNFSHNFLMRVNYRYAKLYGNYEGLFRNDNGQSDPGVSSLFDFTQGVLGLLGNQFKSGFLNTDRRHVANLYGSYVVPSGFLKNLTQGIGFRGQAGAPLTNLGAHPVYDNEGEIPLGNGRGSLGRTASNMQLDLHTDYSIPVREGAKVKLSWDMFNVLNSRSLTQVDQDSELNSTTPNVDYLKPLSFQRAFYARGSVRFEF
ncbi:Cna B domain protein [Terriglobus saanensis SP1PR4]|uniref:Cna B domain protein n=1 Tax=Terriglobus saanensis (strain ATCC BAA-1853 / DSM 23119 / SP1PR4) TaxID=401053 RepID=E8UZU8_TERSS|nr:Cna B domain protein [Terriglobus saanensis SP1PR4]